MDTPLIQLAGCTILIVDDNPINLGIIADYLESYHFNILTATDGADALKIVKGVTPDLILLDVMLPDMDGFEVCRQLKAQKPLQDVPLIFVTALTETEYKIKGFEVGAMDYITKPLQLPEVLSRVMTHLRIRELTAHLEYQVRLRTIELDHAVAATQQLNRELLEANTRLKHEIAEHQRAEAALAESQNQLYATFNAMDDWVFVLDGQERFTHCYTPQKWLYLPLEAFIGKKYSEVLPPDIGAPLHAAFEKSKNNESVEFEYQLKIDADIHWYAAKLSPMLLNDVFTGVVAVVRDITRRKHAEQEKDRLLLQISQSHQQLRAMAIRLAEVQENDRKQLARELHDRVGQNLSTMGFILNILRDQAAPLLPETAHPTFVTRVADVLDMIKQTTDDIRNVMAELRPSVLDDYGLGPALRWYGERFSAQTGLAVTVQVPELPQRLPALIETTLFRILQEALTNVAKHAHATQVTITLTTDAEAITLMISDNGIGFEVTRPTTTRNETGWGLLNMSERAAAVGGEFQIEAAPGRGVTLSVKAPLP
ncbi:MAG TPA: response regulator [Anaerolineae bacterium]|nr:response regulator [Anaerolineae bacterium]